MSSPTQALVSKFDDCLEEVYVAQSNFECPPEEIYYLAEELKDLGIGGVLVHTASGSLKWFCLENMEF